MSSGKIRKGKLTYSDSGVNISAAHDALNRFKASVKETYNEGVLSETGNFGGMFSLSWLGMHDPVLVSSVDGVGTKLIVAKMADKHNTVGSCLVNHCVNDIMVQGARPLFFMDYISVGKLRPEHIASVMEGFTTGCKGNGIALLGGETAEMPDLYAENDYDLAGFIVGAVERSKVLSGENVTAGDIIIGLPSTGLHTNGYSLARKVIFEIERKTVSDPVPGGDGETIGETLLAVHRSYRRAMELLLDAGILKAAAHITGGGLIDNPPRVYPNTLNAVFEKNTWPVPRIFSYIGEAGNIEEKEMYHAFNMGIGMAMIVDKSNIERAIGLLKDSGEQYYLIGKMQQGSGTVELV